MRIAIVSNTAWYLFNFRLNLMRALLQAGHEVVAVAPQDEYVARIEAVGATFAHVSINGRGVNPLREALTVGAFWQIFRRQRVDMVLSYTPKGNLYSALACRMLGKRFVPNVSGLGHAAIHRSWASVASQLLYRLTFGRATRLFFQNEDDMAHFLAQGFVRADQVQRLPGSGVDLQRFVPVPLPEPQADVVFLFMARLLKEKGIHEYVQAARMVRSGIRARGFCWRGSLGAPIRVPSARPSWMPGWLPERWSTWGARMSPKCSWRRPLAWCCLLTARACPVCCWRRRPVGAQ